jgi:hypothetical protein
MSVVALWPKRARAENCVKEKNMSSRALARLIGPTFLWSLGFAFTLANSVAALDSFRSIDNRLPEPNHPYHMTNGTVHFPSSPDFAVYDLRFLPRTPSQLDIPALNKDGNWEFDSSFDIVYKAVISAGLEPPHTVSGYGAARAVGTAPGGSFTQVFDTELVSLNLFGLSAIPEVMFRESPTLRSSGVTMRENTCPPCASIVTFWRISSFFDVFAEVSFNGGNTWTAGDKAIHIEQIADPEKEADYNGNGIIDAGDYIALRKVGGTMYTTYDYDLWRNYFGATTTSSNATTSTGAIPEPSTCFLIGSVALALVFFDSRRLNRLGYRLIDSPK